MNQKRDLRRKVIKLSLPLIASNLSQTILALVDTMMVGRYGSAEDSAMALAAMGPATVIFLVTFLVISAGYLGVQSVCARRFGEGNFEDCGRALDCGLALQTVVGLVAGALGFFFAHDIAGLMFSADLPNHQKLCGDYLQIRMSCALAVTLIWAFKGFFYGIGNTRIDMVITLVMNLLNAFLNYLFIYGNWGAPEMGMPGAAVASSMATGIATLIAAGALFTAKIRQRYHPYKLSHFDFSVVKSIAKLSAPRMMQAAAFGASILFIRMISTSCGPDALAASTIVWRFIGVAVMGSIAIGAATATLVGQALGAKDLERAQATAIEGVKFGFITTSVVGLLMFLFPNFVMSCFTENETVIGLGIVPIRLMASFIMVDAVGIILARVLAVAGCTIYVMVSEIIVSFGFMLGTAYLMTQLFPGEVGKLWLGWVAYMLTWCAAMVFKFKQGSWKHVQV